MTKTYAYALVKVIYKRVCPLHISDGLSCVLLSSDLIMWCSV